jgi:hypothetical protein
MCIEPFSQVQGMTAAEMRRQGICKTLDPQKHQKLLCNHGKMCDWLGINGKLLELTIDNCCCWPDSSTIAINLSWIETEARKADLQCSDIFTVQVFILGHEMGHIALHTYPPQTAAQLSPPHREGVADFVGGAWVAHNLLSGEMIPEDLALFVFDLQKRYPSGDYPDPRDRVQCANAGKSIAAWVIDLECKGAPPLEPTKRGEQIVEFAVDKVTQILRGCAALQYANQTYQPAKPKSSAP